jgi:uroporphyrinogen decarboxylase
VNSKERAKKAFTGMGFDRLPMWYGAEPGTTANTMNYMDAGSEEEMMRKLSIDFRTIRPRYIGPALQRWEDGRFETYWGLIRGGGFWGIALNAPLENAQTLSDIDRLYSFPKVEWFDTKFTAEDIIKAEEYCIIGGMWSPFWHETLELFGLEKMFENMYDNPTLVEAVIEGVIDFNYCLSEEAFKKNKGLIDILGYDGRYIIAPSHDLMMEEIPPENIVAMYDEGKTYSVKYAS